MSIKREGETQDMLEERASQFVKEAKVNFVEIRSALKWIIATEMEE